jgi:hypothetical protein
MTTERIYVLPVEQTDWIVGDGKARFRWEYDDGREAVLALYEKGKAQQWNATHRIDWKKDFDPENPMEFPDEVLHIYGTSIWNRMTPREKADLRRHAQAFQLSQFLHGEQGALICAAKLVQMVPTIDSKFYAATQVMDEARHLEAYSRLLHEKLEMAYPISKGLQALLNNTITDGRWDFLYLGMQVLIEGLALAAFQLIRDQSRNSLASSVTAYVMQDEARHVAFGRLALRGYYPQLSDAERAEREEFIVESCYYLRDRFATGEVFMRLGLPLQECMAILAQSEGFRQHQVRLFSRIVPIVRDIGLLGPRVREAFAKMGILGFAETDATAVMAEDARIAESFDLRVRSSGHGEPALATADAAGV